LRGGGGLAGATCYYRAGRNRLPLCEESQDRTVTADGTAAALPFLLG